MIAVANKIAGILKMRLHWSLNTEHSFSPFSIKWKVQAHPYLFAPTQYLATK